jgi:Peptidase family M28
MAQVHVTTESKVSLSSPSLTLKFDSLIALLCFLVIGLFVFVSFYQLTPPKAVPSGAPLAEFSSGRAMEHIAVIAQKPHPIGSPEHAKVRDYILRELTAIGLAPELQKTTAINEMRGSPFLAGTVENIIGRLQGTSNSKGILFVGHYDSVPTGPGASDDGAAVGAMLETARALKAGSPLTNDVIFLFTDGEEVGLLGASAFVSEHSLSRDVGVVLNFEARGTGGPVMMFETSLENGWLIKQLATSVSYPTANSLSYEIYKRLPNDTDLTVFKKAGYAGLNFAYVKGLYHYHTALDSIENIDERSLQHDGAYALPLARHFGNLSKEPSKESNSIYFNILGPALLHYSSGWVIPLTVAVLTLFVAIVAHGLKRRYLTLKGIALGFLAFLLNMVVAATVVMVVWWIVNAAHTGYRTIVQGEPYNSHIYFASFTAITIAISSASYIWFRKRVSLENLTVGGLLWWLILMVATGLFLPGGSYLFTWPLLSSLIALPFMFASKDREQAPIKRLAVLSICAVPGILLFTPLIYTMFLAMALRMPWLTVILVALLLGLLIPHLSLMTATRKWLLPATAALVGLSLVVAGSLTSHFTKSAPKPNSIFYALNADSGQAVWASSDKTVDEWTSQFLTGDPDVGSLGDYLPSSSNTFLKNQAPVLPLAAPSVVLLNDSTDAGTRVLRMRVNSNRLAAVMALTLDARVEVLAATVNGKRLENRSGKRWALRYFAVPPEGIELTFELKPSELFGIQVTDISYGLPDTPPRTFRSRPDYMMASPVSGTDSTVVTKSFTF